MYQNTSNMHFITYFLEKCGFSFPLVHIKWDVGSSRIYTFFSFCVRCMSSNVVLISFCHLCFLLALGYDISRFIFKQIWKKTLTNCIDRNQLCKSRCLSIQKGSVICSKAVWKKSLQNNFLNQCKNKFESYNYCIYRIIFNSSSYAKFMTLVLFKFNFLGSGLTPPFCQHHTNEKQHYQ